MDQLFILQKGAIATPTEGTFLLGEECSRDRECEGSITNSRCYLGYCRCLPYFAEYNSTHCLECEFQIVDLKILKKKLNIT